MDPALQNKTIMVLDDNVDTSDILRFALEQEGAKVVVAHSVDEVLTTYRESPPHAVITDIRLGL
jgi:DNA-binding response OmpR family regulator